MNNEKEENKKTWQTPEIIDLDVNENTNNASNINNDGLASS
jgi:hypothetical protein